MTKRFVTALSAAAAVVGALLPMTSEAIPAFARQTGKACATCHFQHFPVLNAYGQEFKAGGYTDMGKQGEIKGTDLSLPAVLNGSFLTKIRTQHTNGGTGAGTDATEVQFPDEFGFLLGGRAATNVGFLIEASLIGAGQGPALAGYKMPITLHKTEGGVRFQAIPFTTDALGSSYGFELLNTGAVRNVRVFEHRKESSAQQYIGAGSGSATGLAFVASSADFFVNVSAWAPHINNSGAPAPNSRPESQYVRAAWLGNLMGFESGAGVQMWSGKADNGAGVIVDTKATAVDFQAQGSVAAMPLGVYVTYASAPASDTANVGVVPQNLFNTGAKDAKAFTVAAELGLFSHASVKAAFRNGTTNAGDVDNAFTTGVLYHVAQNIELVAEHSHYSKNKGTLTTLMLESAF